jgi:hypothetical protein
MTGTRSVATGCNDAVTAAAVQDALCGSAAITTARSSPPCATPNLPPSTRHILIMRRGGHANFGQRRPVSSHSTGSGGRDGGRKTVSPNPGRHV